MNGKGLGLVGVLIAIIAAGAYFFAGDLTAPIKDDDTISEPKKPIFQSNDGQDLSESIRVEHSYTKGTHFFSGEINLPTPCHVLEHSVLIAQSFPEQVTILFDTSTKSEMCAQVITPEYFEVSFKASEDAAVVMTLDGEDLPYVTVGETILHNLLEDISTTSQSEDIVEMETESETLKSEVVGE